MQGGTEEKQYFLVKFIYRDNVYYCVWYTNDVDGFILRKQKLLYFDEIADIKTYCIENGIKIYDEIKIVEYDLDKLLGWVENQEMHVDCKFILDYWNIMSDISNSVQMHFMGNGEGMLDIYDKLFYGNNLPCINTSGDIFIPVWSRDELQEIYSTMIQGIHIFESIL